MCFPNTGIYILKSSSPVVDINTLMGKTCGDTVVVSNKEHFNTRVVSISDKQFRSKIFHDFEAARY